MSSSNPVKSQSGRTLLEIVTRAAEEAGKVLVKNFRKGLKASRKGRGNFLSEADLLSEKTIVIILKEEFPDSTIISEESYPEPAFSSDFAFIIDPVDGTNNYCFGLPYFCINIAVIQKGKVTLGLVHDPLRKETFRAEKGRGTYLNNERVFTSARNSLQECLLGFDFGYSEIQGREVLGTVMGLWPGVHSFRALGSSSLGLCYVASGRMDLYFHRYLFPWDIAPGLLLVREAGGLVTDWEGGEARLESSQIIAGSAEVHRLFSRWLKESRRQAENSRQQTVEGKQQTAPTL